MATKTKLPREVRSAINAVVGYLAYDEIKNLRNYDYDDKSDDNIDAIQSHIAQSVITLAKWIGGDAGCDVYDLLERWNIVKQPDGWWAWSDNDNPNTESRGEETAPTHN